MPIGRGASLGPRAKPALTKPRIKRHHVRAENAQGYGVRRSVRGYCHHLRKLATGRGCDAAVATATAERARLARAQAELAETRHPQMWLDPSLLLVAYVCCGL